MDRGLGVAGAIMLATLSVAVTTMPKSNTVLPPATQQPVANRREHYAQMISKTSSKAVAGRAGGDSGRDRSN